MTLRPNFAAISLGLAFSASILAAAKPAHKKPKTDPVLDAIQQAETRDKTLSGGETAVLDGNEPSPAAGPTAKDAESVENPNAGPPVKVTGKPPEDAGPAATPPSEPPDLTKEPPKPPEELAIRVEKVRSGNGTIDPAQVTLTAPFPAKPLNAVPIGWHLDVSGSAPPFSREVELGPGTPLTLTIHPHVLVPDADGIDVFTIPEPGYHYPLGYRQTGTVGAILSNSILQLDEDSKKLGTAIDNLQQLLTSLPKPDLKPQPEAKPTNFRKK